MIPKIIWQTHEWGYQDMPDNFKGAAMTWQNLNPRWEYRYANAVERAKQVESFSPELYMYYPFMDKPTQSDVWRYVVLYQNGGVYADMDSASCAPLDYTISKMPESAEIATPKPTKAIKNSVINNSNFVAKKDSALIKSMLDGMLDENRSINLSSIIKASKSCNDMSILQAISLQLRNGLFWYSSVLLENADKIWTEYADFIHSETIKDPTWEPTHEVDYYGQKRNYLDLVEENGWSLI